jgi:murein DD-endopeptidase MepM/ murein hydrolase activator NlpD
MIALAGAAAGLAFTRLEGDAPLIQGRTTESYVGDTHARDFSVVDHGMGVRRVRVWIEGSDGQRHELQNEEFDGNALMGASLGIARIIQVEFSPASIGLEDGRATLSIEAEDFAWDANVARLDVPLVIDRKPPRVAVLTGLTYVRRGGTELAIYSVDEDVALHGVRVGDSFSPGYPHPADPGRFLAFYPLPPDTPPGSSPVVVAEDRAGNKTQVGLSISIIERSFPSDRVNVGDAFLQKKVPELLGGEHPDLLASYLKINREMRKENAAKIAELTSTSSEERLWRGPFVQLPNSNVGERFGVRRTYEYQGREVDQQTHLGYDLASTARATVPASNSGVVVFVGDLGIYGQTVIVDHGLSLFSLYGHLSEISVAKGEVVAQGDPLGRTGETGLAGGDHLHYGMIVSGVFVDPLEWFDGRWIEEHIEVKFAVPEANGANP